MREDAIRVGNYLMCCTSQRIDLKQTDIRHIDFYFFGYENNEDI